MQHQFVQIVAQTVPSKVLLQEGIVTLEDFIGYVARVSNPSNQTNTDTMPKLLKWLVGNRHWSPFEMAHIVIEINTTRDIGRQILRHRSFSFQEFSQRYAQATEFVQREARLQDKKNRQNSIETDDQDIRDYFDSVQQLTIANAEREYVKLLEMGVAKEQARAILPEGLTMSRLYMAGSLRSWVHYCDLRMKNGTQKEHMEIAQLCWAAICRAMPSLEGTLDAV